MNVPFSLFAEISTGEAMTICVVGLSALFAFYAKVGAARKSLVEEIKAALRAEQSAPASQVSVQQPFEVKPTPRYASSDAFGRHVEADRAEHEKLRTETLRVERELGTKVDLAKKEILDAGEKRQEVLNKTINENREHDRNRVDRLMRVVASIQGAMGIKEEGE